MIAGLRARVGVVPREELVAGDSVRARPIAIERLVPERVLTFSAEAPTAIVPVTIPYLAGMDELVVQSATMELRGRVVELSPVEASAATMGVTHTVGLGPSATDPRRGRLVKLELLGLSIDVVGAGGPRTLRASSGSPGSLTWTAGEDAAVTLGVDVASGKALHVLVRAATGDSRPPLVACPSIPMPGDGADLYGPALGGGVLTLRSVDGKADAILELAPGLELRGVEIAIREVTDDGGMPNQLKAVGWSATTIRATFVSPPCDLVVEALDPPKVLPVAGYPGPLSPGVTTVDFGPVARTTFAARYPSTPPSSAALELELRFSSSSAGTLDVLATELAAEYRRAPFGERLVLDLLGALETAAGTVPEGRAAKALTATLDGVFGPSRLVDACAQAPRDEARAGVRLTPGRRCARFVPLSEAERGLPISRVAIFGRADTPTEVLVSLCTGEVGRMGIRRGPPVSLSFAPGQRGAWVRADVPVEAGAAPHGTGYHVAVEVTRGALWWYTSPGFAGTGMPHLHSLDDGRTWSRLEQSPVLTLHVHDVDATTGLPRPMPIAVSWPFGVLTADLLGLEPQGVGVSPPGFRVEGMNLLGRDPGPDAPLDRLRDAAGRLELAFSCRRDLKLSIVDALLSYHPFAV